MPVPEDLLAIMACPACHGSLEERGEARACQQCGLHYPVRDDIPILLPEAAYRPEEGRPAGACAISSLRFRRSCAGRPT